MDKKPTFYVVAGPNGAGKSTFSKHIIEKGIKNFNPDEYAKKEMEKGLSELEANKKFLREIKERINSKKSFALETTLAGHNAVARMYKFLNI